MCAQALNLILLTSPEVRELRELLREAGQDPRGAAFFNALYPCWSHSTGALLSLCFLAQVGAAALLDGVGAAQSLFMFSVQCCSSSGGGALSTFSTWCVS